MSPKPTQPDLAQLIAEHVARTSEPRNSIAAARAALEDPSQERIGTVPLHLRHLHNLLEELDNEADAAAHEYHKRKERLSAVRTLFFASLETHVPHPEGASGIMICQDWSVVANMDDDRGSDLAGMLAAAIVTGALRR